MRITKFWAKGYRSLKDVTLDPLGPFNVFYGPNGSGKSNVLAAIRATFDALRVINSDAHAMLLNVQHARAEDWKAKRRAAGDAISQRRIVGTRDFCALQREKVMTLGAAIQLTEGAVQTVVEVEFEFDEVVRGEPRATLTRLSLGGVEAPMVFQSLAGGIDGCRAALQAICDGFSIVDSNRFPMPERHASPPDDESPVRWHLRAGRLKSALFDANNADDPEVRRRFKVFRALMAGEPLLRPPFDTVRDPRSGDLDLREPLGDGDVSVDLVGLGVAQVYAILAGVLLSNASVVGLEEPEAHLHAPTLGRHLRKLMLRTVRESYIDQLFIATHSNLFDLDPDGYWDVSMVDGETRVVRKPLHEIDRHHLWETGPTRHALMLMLRYAPADKVVFAHADGRPITAGQMLQYLRDDDVVTKRFLDNLHGAALDMMRIAADREPKP